MIGSCIWPNWSQLYFLGFLHLNTGHHQGAYEYVGPVFPGFLAAGIRTDMACLQQLEQKWPEPVHHIRSIL